MAENDFTVNFDQDTFMVVFGEQGPQGPAAAAVPFDITEVFEIGNIVYDTTGDLFGSRINNNVGNPLTDTDSWVALGIASGVVTQLDDLTDVTLSSPTDTQVMSYNASTQQWMNTDQSGGQTLTAGNGIDIISDVISVDPSEILADGTNPGTIPALPTDLGSSIFTENLKSDGQFYDDGSQYNLVGGLDIARAPNGGTGNQYVAHTAGDGIGFTLDGDNHLITSVVDDGITTAKIVDNAVTVDKLGSIPIDTLSDVDTTTVTPIDDNVLTWDQSNTEWRPLALPLRSLADVPNVVNANQILRRTADNTAFEWADGSGASLTEGFGIDITSDEINWDASPNEVRSAGAYSMVAQWTEDTAIGNGQFAFLTAPAGFNYQVEFNKNDGEGNVVLDDASVATILGSTISIRSATGNGYYYVEEQGEAIASYTFNLRFLSGNDILDGEPADLIIAIFSSTESLLASTTVPGFIPVLSGVATEYLDGSGAFSTPAGGGGQSDTDYNNANFGNFGNGAITWTYDASDNLADEGDVSYSDDGVAGYTLSFRTQDVDLTNSVSVNYFQIGFGSPVAFATYAVADLTIDGTRVNLSLIDGPLDGDDVLATTPADNQALSISVSVREFIQPDLGDLPDVDFSTAPTDGQVLAYELASDTWIPADGGSGGNPDLGDLGDVNTNGVADGFIIRYDGDNSNYRAHSVSDTNRAYGGIDVDMSTGFTIPAATGALSVAIGDGATSTHSNSTALGQDATTDENNEIRLGDGSAHVTVPTSVAGNESEDNQLVSKRWVNNQISDASRVISSTANALENLTEVTESTPWDDYRIVVQDALNEQNLQVHMYEFDATQSQFIFYPGFVSSNAFGTGAGLTTGTIPDFFEEVTNVANEAEVTNAGGDAVTSLGWKYLGHDTATVWQAVSHVFTFDFEWIYPADNNDGAQNPPDVTSSIELVRLKPLSDNTYSMNTNATVVASSPTSFHNAGQLNPGDTESFTGSYEFAQQLLADGISNVENGDVFAYRMKIRYKGNGFDGATNVRLAITESETSNITPQFGIRHVGRDYSLVLEDSGDLQWTDHGSAIETNLLLIENTTDGPIIPAAALGLTEGNGIDITGKSIAAQISGTDSGLTLNSSGLAVLGGNAIDVTSTGVNVVLNPNSGLSINGGDGLSLDANISDLADVDVNDSILSNNQVLTWNEDTFEGDAWRAVSFDLDILGDTVISSPTDGQVLTYESSDQTWRNQSVPAGSTTLAALTDTTIATPTDGQVITYNTTSNTWENTSLSGNHSFTAGDGLSFNADGTVLNSDLGDVLVETPATSQVLAYDADQTRWENTTFNVLPYSHVSFNDGDNRPTVGLVATRSITMGPDSSSTASNATTIGYSATGNGLSSTTLGDNANGAGNNSVSLGHDSDATDVATVAIGDSSGATNIGSIAIGSSATASGNRSTAMGNAASATADSGVAIGNGAGTAGARAIAIGDDPSTGSNALGIAIGERSRVTGTRGIAIGSSSNSADADADLVTAAENSIAIGRAASATATGATAIGDGAIANTANTTVLGSGVTHNVFAGTRQLQVGNQESASFGDIACSINNDFFGGGFNPSSTVSEELRYNQMGELVVGRFEFALTSTAQTGVFAEGQRWTLNSSSIAMLEAFGFNLGNHAIAIGTFVISGSSYSSAVMGDVWLHPSTTATNVVMSFRTRSSIGTGPTLDSVVSCQFNFAKF